MSLRNDPNVSAFQMAASRYCELFESVPEDSAQWLRGVLLAVSQLYASAHLLPDVGIEDDTSDVPDSMDVGHEEWRALFQQIQKILGSQDLYWAYFDPTEPGDTSDEAICGSLADDLADIYRDIKPGLRAWEMESDICLTSIVFGWKQPNFESHWGVHAVSAMRALHPLVYSRGLSNAAQQSVEPDRREDAAPG
jgi:hypothetical protein